MADSVFHKDFKAMPWWWEWWHPNNELSQDPLLRTDVLVVGAGYGGLSTALELGRSGVDVTVLERGRFRRRRLDPQRRRRQRRHHHGQGLLRQGRRRRLRDVEEDHAAHAGRRGRFAGPGRD